VETCEGPIKPWPVVGRRGALPGPASPRASGCEGVRLGHARRVPALRWAR